MELQEIVQQIDALQARGQELTQKAADAKSSEEVADLKAVLQNDVIPQLTQLQADREQAMRDEEIKSLQGQVGDLTTVINDLRSGFPSIAPGAKGVTDNHGSDDNYADGKHSFFNDIRLVGKGLGSNGSLDRLTKGLEGKGLDSDGKAMTEGTGAQGGYLVQTQIERQILNVRELDNVLRPICSTLNVTATTIELDQITMGTTAGWVAELATKPEGTSLTLASVTAGVFTAAGLATISNQLLADSNPAVDGLVTTDLAKRLVALEETAFLAGTGTGQPLGILNTPGVNTKTTTTPGSGTVVSGTGGIIDTILDAISQTQTDYGQPNYILMHPRTWTAILKDKNTSGLYTYDSPADATNNSPAYANARTVYNGPTRTLWGVPVILSNRMPTNLGAGSNESRIIVGDFSQALILDRQGITVDESPHVYFTSNQTVFRAETRVGFTAARQPKAFCVIGGTSLANS